MFSKGRLAKYGVQNDPSLGTNSPTKLVTERAVREFVGDYKWYSAHIRTNAGAGTVLATNGDWISSVTRNAVGDYTVYINSGIFTQAPIPFVTAYDNLNVYPNIVVQPTTTAVRVRIRVANSNTQLDGASTNEGFFIMVHGK